MGDINQFKQKSLKWLSNKYNLALLIILAIAFLLRVKLLYIESVWNDSAVTLWHALKVLREPSFFFSSEFLSEYVILKAAASFFYPFVKDIVLSGRIVVLLFNLLGIIYIYLLGSEIKNKLAGLIAAILLTFNHIFWFIGSRFLADAPLATTFVIGIYYVLKLEKENKLRWAIAVIASIFLALMVKKQGILLYLALLVYYTTIKRKKMFTNKNILASWLVPLIFITFGSIIYYMMFKDNLIQGLFKTIFRFNAINLETLKTLPFLLSWYILPFFILGVILLLFYKKKFSYMGLVTIAVYYLVWELNITPLPRYLLPMGAFMFVVAAYAIDEVGEYLRMFLGKRIKLIVTLFFLVIAIYPIYNQGKTLIEDKAYSYIGHREAGQWIKDNVPEDAIVLAGSPRMVRLFSEREYAGPGKYTKGGSVWFLRAGEYFYNQSLFESDFDELAKNNELFLEIDIWEYGQPPWYYPLSQDSINYFTGLGFKLINIIEKDIPTQNGLQKTPVIFLFKFENTTSSQ